jgi:methyltransferase (TIGR00027 family)
MNAKLDPKWTAQRAAVARAIGSADRWDGQHGDYLARALLPAALRAAIRFPLARWVLRASYDARVPGSRQYHAARTRVFDGIFERAATSRGDAIVIVGAGLDTRAYRFAAQLGAQRVVEVDHPATSRLKRARADAARLTAPLGLCRLELDVTRVDALSQLLQASGGRASLVLCEGLLPYLTARDADVVFELTRQLGSGTQLAFDYLNAGVLTHPERYFGARENMWHAARIGEPYRSAIHPERLPAFLAARGLKLVKRHTSSELARALRDRSARRPRILECMEVAVAEVR